MSPKHRLLHRSTLQGLRCRIKESPSLMGRHLSKSASELSHRGDVRLETARAAERERSTPSAAHHLSVIQKTHSFFTSLKARWARSRSRERRSLRRVEMGPGPGGSPLHGGYGGYGGRDSPRSGTATDYTADNSSEGSPLTMSPKHRLLHRSTLQESHAYPGMHIPSTETVSMPGDSPRFLPRQLTHPSSTTVEPLPLPSDPLISESQRKKETVLRQYSFFQLRVHLRRGKDLVARDKSGTSDPYVKFKVNGRLMYKSKTIYRDLNPQWDESFTLPVEDVFTPVHIKVFDYDWGLQDDFMGASFLDLTALELGRAQDISLTLQDPDKPEEYLGEIVLTTTLWPRTQEDKEQYFQRNSRISDMNRRLKSQIWSSVVTIVLIDAKNLLAMDLDGYSDPYVKFRLGQEKYKSKVIYKSLNPTWLEQFDLHLYDDQSQELEVTVWDKDRSKDDFIGKCSIDLSQLEREKTHKIKKDLEDGAGSIQLLLTISGTTASETISDLTTYEVNPREKEVLLERYALQRTFHNLKDVGHLTVRVYKAQGLAAADLGGKSDPFCVLELVNARLQTQTEYKTLTPSWQKIFTFNVKDIHSVLEVTVYDEDKDHKVEFLGKVAIPLIRIKNGEKRWYALKDKKLYGRAKGNSPQILLEMDIVWNPIRACIRTLNPKEDKYMNPEVKFKRQVFVRNVMRLKAIIMWIIDISKVIQRWLEWESTIQSIIALTVFILLCYYFEPYMAPLAMILVFLKCYVVQTLMGNWSANEDDDEPTGDDDDDDEDKDREEKKSLKEKLQAIQEVTQTVQNSIGFIASLGEQVKNTFNFTVPFLSFLAMFLTTLICFVLYWVPVRYLIMAWGINKFARKLIRPHTVPNNEVLDLLSRVPDNEELIAFRELRVQQTSDPNTGGAGKRDLRKKPKGS
ncbi:multiple C2 and transmembrane domain-containing protein isoform X2 [Bemisia tabaci]|uniref:multiple C2 and transmembrane domain-containing protein isoform X2 n=2 Tax=Bemisia tabaci TaxID=7038 RepID=UPI003B27C9D8